MTTRTLPFAALVLAALAAAGPVAAAAADTSPDGAAQAPAGVSASNSGPMTDVNIIIDMTDEGHKAPHPTRGSPIYYHPVIGGYSDEGAVVRGEVPPKPLDVIHAVARALADQGYLVQDQLNPPSLIMAIHWGTMYNAQVNMNASDSTTDAWDFNRNKALALVAGKTVDNLDLSLNREKVNQMAEDDRYFIVLTAYDYGAFVQGGKKVLLWQGKISVPNDGITFKGVLSTMMQAAGPHLGLETTSPVSVVTHLPEGHVELGTAVEVPLTPAAGAPGETGKAP